MSDMKKQIIRFKEFPNPNNSVTLSSISKSIKAGKSKKEEGGKYPLYGSTGIIGLTNKKMFSNENILIARVGANAGFIYQGKGQYGVSDNTLIVELNPNVELNYIYYSLLSSNLNRLVFGSGQPLITGKLLKKIKLHLPSLPEQEKIADFLSTVDKKIQALSKKKELLESYKKGVIQKLFEQEFRFKKDDGSDYPEWEEKRLGSLTKKAARKNKENLQLPIYSINNIEGFLPQSEQFEGMDSNDRGYDISMYKIIQSNTFAYNPARINVGSIGFSGELFDVIISSLYVCFKTTEDLNDLFLWQYTNTYNFIKSVNKYLEGGVRQYLFFENFSRIKIQLPGVEEQTKIANFLSAIDDKINVVASQIDKIKEWKKGLLQQMFV